MYNGIKNHISYFRSCISTLLMRVLAGPRFQSKKKFIIDTVVILNFFPLKGGVIIIVII
jgi:hypothetical protein